MMSKSAISKRILPVSAVWGVACLMLVLSGCSSMGSAPASKTTPFSGHHIKTVFIIVMENHNWTAPPPGNYSSVVSPIENNPNAPYINKTLIPMASHANNYNNPPHNHPSLPNYLWLEAGTNFGILADVTPYNHSQTTTQHLVTLLSNANISWASYAEGVEPGMCDFKVFHNPFVFFDDVTDNLNPKSPDCVANMHNTVQFMTDLTNNTVARYNFIVPDYCHSMHDSCNGQDRVKEGDDWLSKIVPAIMQSQAYQNGGVIFLTWDEAERADGPIPMIVLSPFAKGNGYSNNIYYNHGSTLRTVEEIFGVTPLLRDAAQETDLSDLFRVFP